MARFNEANFNSLQETARKINEGSKNFNTEEGIKAWLDKMGIDYYTINDDLTVDVNGDVNLSGKKGLTKIPIQFGIVRRRFDCSYNQITSLKGAPRECRDFNCSHSELTSLRFAPQECMEFQCQDNKLTSLKGVPQKCRYLDCSNNPGNFTKEDVLKICKAEYIEV